LNRNARAIELEHPDEAWTLARIFSLALQRGGREREVSGAKFVDFISFIKFNVFSLTVVAWSIYGGDEHYVLKESSPCAE
jgi:hypothetical protein